MDRVCNNGHTVTEDYLKACPRCGSQLNSAAAHLRTPPLAPAVDQQVSVPLTLPFAVGGVILLLFGGVLTFAAERGPAEVFGWLLLAAGVVLMLVGVVDAVRRRRTPD